MKRQHRTWKVCLRSRVTRCSCTARGRWMRLSAVGAFRPPAASALCTSTTVILTTLPRYSPKYAFDSRTSWLVSVVTTFQLFVLEAPWGWGQVIEDTSLKNRGKFWSRLRFYQCFPFPLFFTGLKLHPPHIGIEASVNTTAVITETNSAQIFTFCWIGNECWLYSVFGFCLLRFVFELIQLLQPQIDWLIFATCSMIVRRPLCLDDFGWRSNPQISIYKCVVRPFKCTCQMASESVEWFKQITGMWQTTDRQTDHTTGNG